MHLEIKVKYLMLQKYSSTVCIKFYFYPEIAGNHSIEKGKTIKTKEYTKIRQL
jgi:hypothetical protein